MAATVLDYRQRTPDRLIYGVTICYHVSITGSRLHRHSPSTTDFEVAHAIFDECVKEAPCTTAARVSLYAYAGDETMLLDEWVRPNSAFACDMHRETRDAFDRLAVAS